MYRVTGELEMFQNLILKYASKRFTYTPSMCRVRNRLAALDYNIHNNRPMRRKKNGETM